MPASHELRFSLTRPEIVGAIQACYQARYNAFGPAEAAKIEQDLYTYRVALAVLNDNVASLPTGEGVA